MRLKSRCPLPQFRVSRPCAWGSSPCVGTAREDGPLEGHWSRFNPKRAACYYRTSGKHGYLVPHSAWRERGSRRRGQQCGTLRESSDMSPRWTQTGVLIQPPMDTDGSPDTTPNGHRRESSDATPDGHKSKGLPPRDVTGNQDGTPCPLQPPREGKQCLTQERGREGGPRVHSRGSSSEHRATGSAVRL